MRAIAEGRKLARALVLLALVSASACGDGGSKSGSGQAPERPANVLLGTVSSRETQPVVDGRDLTQLVAGNSAFALDAFAQLGAAAPTQNIAIGPYSISQAMAMLYAGASGQTAAELRSALHFDVEPTRFHQTFNGLGLELLSRNGDVTLRIANQVWAQTGFQPGVPFLDTLMRDYDAPLALADFATDPEGGRVAINDWVRRVTADKISQLFPPGTIDGSTTLVLTNAMYLDAPWKYQFDRKSTRPAPFTLPDGSEKMVDMMHFDDFLPSGGGPDWQAVELPYRGDELSMIALLPDDLAAFEASLSPARLTEVLDAIRDGGIHLSLPRFTFSFHSSLVETFKQLGAPSLFAAADLSGIAPGLRVGAIEHEVYVQVDEDGTKAAAATGVDVPASHGPTIDFDHPFLFFIVDRPTRTLLFVGRVTDPSTATD